jgi:DNA-binding XRE family transcriptional regulator
MSTFADQLKSEISRLARKEVRAETQGLKKSITQHRSEIAGLKKRLSALESQLRKISKGAGTKVSGDVQETAIGALRFRAGGFASLRKKLGINAAEMGLLLGVSAQSIYHWEAGKSKPRASQLAAIAEVRSMGKRAVALRLLS